MTEQRNSARAAWDALRATGGVVTAAAMAERLEVSRARVSAMVARDDFPPPIDTLGRTPIWLWVEVQAWREAERKPGPKSTAARSDE